MVLFRNGDKRTADTYVYALFRSNPVFLKMFALFSYFCKWPKNTVFVKRFRLSNATSIQTSWVQGLSIRLRSQGGCPLRTRRFFRCG